MTPLTRTSRADQYPLVHPLRLHPNRFDVLRPPAIERDAATPSPTRRPSRPTPATGCSGGRRDDTAARRRSVTPARDAVGDPRSPAGSPLAPVLPHSPGEPRRVASRFRPAGTARTGASHRANGDSRWSRNAAPDRSRPRPVTYRRISSRSNRRNVKISGGDRPTESRKIAGNRRAAPHTDHTKYLTEPHIQLHRTPTKG